MTGARGTPQPGSLVERGRKVLMETYARTSIELASGRGCRVTDLAGRTYLDMVGGIAVNVLGHGHPAVVAALQEGALGMLHVSNLYWTEPMIRLAERLTAATGMDRAFFCNSGAEAVESTIKLARKARPDRRRIVAFERSFHGRTLGALSVTAQPRYQAPFQPLLAGVEILPYGDAEAAERAIDFDTALVLVEAVQGEGGLRPAPAGFLARLRACCDAKGAMLAFDEVQTGVGRTGKLYAFQTEDVVPDAIATSKALAGGLPLGALLARGAVAEAFTPGDHASTFGGGPFVATVANAVLDVVLADGFLEGVRGRGARLGEGLASLARRHPVAVEARGRGLMWGLVLDGERADELVRALAARGVLALPAGKDVLRLVPPLVISEAEIDEALGHLDAALGEISGGAGSSAASS